MTTMSLAMSLEEFEALPDDGVERWLVHGELREGEMTVRNFGHSATIMRMGFELSAWMQRQPDFAGEVIGGEAGITLFEDSPTRVGVDVAVISPEVVATVSDDRRVLQGVPTLVVEVLSPSDKQEHIVEKVDLCLSAGVPMVWVADPHFRTIVVYRPDAPTVLFNDTQTITADPALPGFAVAVSKLFPRK